jgi:hypothetical protein
MYGYASEPRRRSYPDLLLTLRDRCDEDWRCDMRAIQFLALERV